MPPINRNNAHVQINCSYYDCQLSKAQQKFGDQVLTFNLCCCHRQMASRALIAVISGLTCN